MMPSPDFAPGRGRLEVDSTFSMHLIQAGMVGSTLHDFELSDLCNTGIGLNRLDRGTFWSLSVTTSLLQRILPHTLHPGIEDDKEQDQRAAESTQRRRFSSTRRPSMKPRTRGAGSQSSFFRMKPRTEGCDGIDFERAVAVSRAIRISTLVGSNTSYRWPVAPRRVNQCTSKTPSISSGAVLSNSMFEKFVGAARPPRGYLPCGLMRAVMGKPSHGAFSSAITEE